VIFFNFVAFVLIISGDILVVVQSHQRVVIRKSSFVYEKRLRSLISINLSLGKMGLSLIGPLRNRPATRNRGPKPSFSATSHWPSSDLT
jgi:hypothetical protein